MRFFTTLAIALQLACASMAHASELVTRMVAINGQQIRVGTQSPDPGKPIVGDVLYLHGFGDRLDNHAALFAEWNKKGLRVISFDYPGHGLSSGSINRYSVKTLGAFAGAVEKLTLQNPSRPLVLAGWSAGGLVAARVAEGKTDARFSRPLKGLVLIAPGLAVDLTPKNWDPSKIRECGNPDPHHAGEFRPTLLKGAPFLMSVIGNMNGAWKDPMPPNLPVALYLGGDDKDRSVNTPKLREWARKQRDLHGADISGIQFDGLYHELDNELDEDGGAAVRNSIANFAAKAARGQASGKSLPAPPGSHPID